MQTEVDNQLRQRRKLYFQLSSEIAQIDNARLCLMFDDTEPHTSWGKNQVIDLGRSKVFVKRVPVTEVEYSNMFSTRNLYNLPTFYNYGFGSVGMGVFRELVTHIKTTNWVLAGAIAKFPLMYHYRLVPFDGVRGEVDPERHARYVAYWSNDANVGRYMLDRAAAKYELVLFLEYIPYTVSSWLPDNITKVPLVMADMHSAVAFLRKHGMLHLDAHASNMLTDGKRVYLTDFGLTLSKHFELTPEEMQFYRQHSYFDYGYLLWGLQSPLASLYDRLPDAGKASISERYGLKPEAAFEDLISTLRNNIDDLASSAIMELDWSYVATLVRYRSVITLMHDFYSEMRKNNAKDTRFDHAKLRRLLKESGFVPALVSNG